MTFHHQTIFDPKERCMKPLQPFESIAHNTLYPPYLHLTAGQAACTSIEFPFLGHIEQDTSIAAAVADGLVDPSTLEAFNLPEEMENLNHLNRRHTMHAGARSSGSSGSGSGSGGKSGGGTDWSRGGTKGYTGQKRTSSASTQAAAGELIQNNTFTSYIIFHL